MDRYTKIVLLGTSQLAYQCAKIIQEFKLDLAFYDTNKQKSRYLERIFKINHIDYTHFPKEKIFSDLSEIEENALIISVVNPYLIPTKILEKENITAINLHHALLPKHPGRNAEAWAIFDMDCETGITWHMITPEVDRGNILDQRTVKLDDRLTSIKLLKIQNDLAFRSFANIFQHIMSGSISPKPQNTNIQTTLHYSWDVPNNGFLDLSWSGAKISAFLRSMDYGILEVLGKPKLQHKHKIYFWRRYSIEEVHMGNKKDEVLFGNSSLIINKGKYQFILSDYYNK